MDQLTRIILEAGRSGVELSLFVLLPIMVVMLSLMRLLEARGVLDWLVVRLAPALRPAGLTGLGSWLYETHTQQVWWSAQMYRNIGRDEALGPPRDLAAYLDCIHPEDRDAAEQARGLRLAEPSPRLLELLTRIRQQPTGITVNVVGGKDQQPVPVRRLDPEVAVFVTVAAHAVLHDDHRHVSTLCFLYCQFNRS